MKLAEALTNRFPQGNEWARQALAALSGDFEPATLVHDVACGWIRRGADEDGPLVDTLFILTSDRLGLGQTSGGIGDPRWIPLAAVKAVDAIDDSVLPLQTVELELAGGLAMCVGWPESFTERLIPVLEALVVAAPDRGLADDSMPIELSDLADVDLDVSGLDSISPSEWVEQPVPEVRTTSADMSVEDFFGRSTAEAVTGEMPVAGRAGGEVPPANSTPWFTVSDDETSTPDLSGPADLAHHVDFAPEPETQRAAEIAPAPEPEPRRPAPADPFAGGSFSAASLTPESFTPEPFTPEPFTPEPFTPESFSPETVSPESFSPATVSPESFSPESFGFQPFPEKPVDSVPTPVGYAPFGAIDDAPAIDPIIAESGPAPVIDPAVLPAPAPSAFRSADGGPPPWQTPGMVWPEPLRGVMYLGGHPGHPRKRKNGTMVFSPQGLDVSGTGFQSWDMSMDWAYLDGMEIQGPDEIMFTDHTKIDSTSSALVVVMVDGTRMFFEIRTRRPPSLRAALAPILLMVDNIKSHRAHG